MKKIFAALALVMSAAVFSYAQDIVDSSTVPAPKVMKIVKVKKVKPGFIGKVGSISINSSNSGKMTGLMKVRSDDGQSKKFSLDNNVRVSDENGGTIEAGELKVGKYVSVSSSKDATGEVVANSIQLVSPPKPEEADGGE